MNRVKTSVKVLVLITYIAMITVNILANTLPINGQTTGEVSDAYPNLFAPAGITFAIWGLIYFLLGLHTLYVLGLFRGENNRNRNNNTLLNRVGLLFSLSSLANAAWIFAWHFNRIGLSVLLMLVILITLIVINLLIREARLSSREGFFIRLPFNIYLGWITVATIANITAWLVSIGWGGFGLSEVIWAVVIILVGALIGAVTTLSLSSVAYGLVIIWAYAGIIIKHVSAAGFAGQYPPVIISAAVSIVIMLVASAIVALRPPAAAAARRR